jgi:hypothetical protein
VRSSKSGASNGALCALPASLYDLSLLKGDFTLQRRGKAEHDASFHLRRDEVRVYGKSAVDGTDDAMNLDRACFVDRHLRDLSDVAAKRVIDGQTAMHAGCRVRAPAGFFSSKIKHSSMTRGVG